MSKSEQWIDKAEHSVMKTYGRYPIVAERGEGCRLWDVDGKSYLDFLAGVAVNNLGHCHPKVVKALQEQAGELLHCSNFYHIPKQIDPDIVFPVEPFGGEKIQVGRQDLAYVIEARVEEIFKLVLQAIQQSGYDGLLPAGIVLTGGSAQLRGITDVAERVLNVPARVAAPRNLLGLVDDLQSPAYATSVGLLQWARNGGQNYRPRFPQGRQFGRRVGTFLRALLPG